MIVIVDYGMGNLRSVAKAFKRLGCDIKISSDKKDISKANKLILPGVGFYASGIRNLQDSGIVEVLDKKVLKDKIPILGICLGMQLLTEWGEEGDSRGLGWIKGKTIRFEFKKKNISLRIPHIGWNSISLKKNNLLFKNLPSDSQFYFVHSYYVDCEDKTNILATTDYGYEFVSVIKKDNIYGTQFHPEKSHKSGLQLLRNFIENG